ncbi:MAG: ribonuclease P protein component [Lachnospiraceae bacterium]|nr:ribonuclease P protein component [Lachnospiraceae bacterium]
MKFTERLRDSKQFSDVYQNGRSKANRYLVMYIRENDKAINRFGISVSKKVGNSVVRHRCKRLLRESYRLHENMFNSGLDIAVVVRGSASAVSYKEMESALMHLMRLHRIMKPGS